jgi:riboflavin transporter FmnP
MNGMKTMEKETKNSLHSNAGVQKGKLLSVRAMTAIAFLSAIATILMLFEIPLWFVPKFYELDFSEVPVLIGAFALGPVAGVLIELLKVLLNLVFNGTDTAFIGELANFLVGCSLMIPSAIVYRIYKTKKSAVIGMVIGTLTFVLVGSLLNAFLLLPVYSKMFIPMDIIIAEGTKVNKYITNMSSFIIYGVAPFNLVKGIMASIITATLYKYVSPIIKGYHE